MLLHFILLLFVVCTAEICEEICEFHSFYLLFLCVSRPLEILLSASLDACDNFSFPFVVIYAADSRILRASKGKLR